METTLVWRGRSKRSECIPKCTGYSKIQCSFCAAFQKMRFKMAQEKRQSGDEALAPVYGTEPAKFPYKPILHYAYSLLKENNIAINRLPLGLYALFYKTSAKIMLPPQAQTAQYRFLRRSRLLYGNQKSPLSCRSSVLLQKRFFSRLGRSGWFGRSNGNQALPASSSGVSRNEREARATGDCFPQRDVWVRGRGFTVPYTRARTLSTHLATLELNVLDRNYKNIVSN